MCIVGVNHYENFPVASLLCPPRWRQPIAALYAFARTADDLADEGDMSASQRRALLAQYRQDLGSVFAGQAPSGAWAQVFAGLQRAVQDHRLPQRPLEDLLDAFEHDTHNIAPATRDDLLTYSARSANPIGRLLLHLYGLQDAVLEQLSDRVCTGLQLVNFWQDLSVDLPRGRIYLPQEDARRHGVDLSQPARLVDSPATQALVGELCAWAQTLLHQGAPLALALPGRVGWELRLVVLGGLRVLEKIRTMSCRTLGQRPVLHAWDVAQMCARAVRYRSQFSPASR